MTLGGKRISSGMPQITSAFNGWMRPITLSKRKQTKVDALLVETDTPFTFRGTIQPLSAKELYLKPEGQRAFQWLQIHCATPGAIDDNDRIVYQGQIYKVMGNKDYSLNGFIEYHLIKDYQ